MELMIIQYSLAIPLAMYVIAMPLRYVIIIKEVPKTLWITYNPTWWKKPF